MKLLPRLAAPAAFAALASLAAPAAAEPTEPVVIGWWSYFTPEGPAYQVPTTDPKHPVTSFGDPDTYYYEPSGGHGLQEDPSVLPPDQAWQSIISFILTNTNSASLSADFTINTSSDLSQWTQAYFGWALVLLYVPKDKYCDSYRIHIGTVDDGVQAMANAKILGYANLGDQDRYIDMVEYQTSNLVLRPGINEVVLIHEDQAAVERYVRNAWIEHNGQQIPLAPKNIVLGQVTDKASKKPIYESLVTLGGNGHADTFLTGPFGFYFFDGLQDGAYQVSADAAGYVSGAGSATLATGAGATEVVRADMALDQGCTCPSGKICGPSGGCLEPCTPNGEFAEICTTAGFTCVNHVCVANPCDTLTCSPGFHCQAGTAGTPPVPVGKCVELACSNVCCQPGQICSAGACVTDNCAGGCPDGQTCSGGNCVDACSVIHCVAPLACVQGLCIDPCVANPASCQPDGGAGGGINFGGSGGTGGSTTGTGTSSGGSGGSGGSGAGSKSGCGCLVAGEDEDSGLGSAAALGLLGAGLVVARRRRR
jgi:MYXO-CTERM domain-containing protein